jgi:hypothetical protein
VLQKILSLSAVFFFHARILLLDTLYHPFCICSWNWVTLASNQFGTLMFQPNNSHNQTCSVILLANFSNLCNQLVMCRTYAWSEIPRRVVAALKGT